MIDTYIESLRNECKDTLLQYLQQEPPDEFKAKLKKELQDYIEGLDDGQIQIS